MLCDKFECGWNCAGYCADEDDGEMENRVIQKLGITEKDRSKDCPKSVDK